MNKISRRSAIASISGAAVVMTPPVAAASSGSLQALIQSHMVALAVSDAAWNVVSDIDEANRIPSPKVRIGRVLRGKNDDGSDIFDPIFAHFPSAIDADCNERLDFNLSMFGGTPARDAKIRENCEARRARLKAELEALEKAERDAEDACGLTAAREKARSASNIVDERLEAILSFPYQTIREVREACSHLVQCRVKGVEGVDPETLEDFMKRLGGGVS